jgi:uncharacterized cupin superfamily protein
MSNWASVVNINTSEFDEPRDHDGFRARRARLGYQLGTALLGLSLWELPAGEAAYPFHFHLVEEELVIVLEGRPSLRTSTGWRLLSEGEAVSFPRGEAGAHQLVNRTGTVVRFLAVSTNGTADIVHYPDSGKIGIAERRPDGGGLHAFFRTDSAVDYWDGETPSQPDHET